MRSEWSSLTSVFSGMPTRVWPSSTEITESAEPSRIKLRELRLLIESLVGPITLLLDVCSCSTTTSSTNPTFFKTASHSSEVPHAPDEIAAKILSCARRS